MNENIQASMADEDILSFEVSDEALEAVAAIEQTGGAYTLGACTGLSACPS